MNKILIGLLMLSAALFAQPGELDGIQSGLCELVYTTLSLLGILIALSILLVIPLVFIGTGLLVYWYLKNREDRKWMIAGIIVLAIAVGAPLLLAVFYLIVPLLIGALTGADIATLCHL